MTQTIEITTRTVNGTTYHQDPADHEMWYANPADIGREGLAACTGELDEIRAHRSRIAREIRKADAQDDADWLAEATDELASCDAEIALLTALVS